MQTTVPGISAVLPETGEVAAILRASDVLHSDRLLPCHDAAFSASLSICLNSTTPLLLVWGVNQICLYNDACIPALGPLHPGLLGSSLLEEGLPLLPALAPQLKKLGLCNASFAAAAHGPAPPDATWSCIPIRNQHGSVIAASCVPAVAATVGVVERIPHLVAALEQSPAFIAILKGPDYVIESANRSFRKILGFRPILARPLAQALPEFVEQGFLALLDQVRRSGLPFFSESMTALIKRPSENEPYDARLNFVCQPLRHADGSTEAILLHGVDITQQYRSQARDSFLLALEDELQGLSDPQQILETSVVLLGRHLKVNRCAYGFVSPDGELLDVCSDYVDGMESMHVSLKIRDLPDNLRSAYIENRPAVFSRKADGSNADELPLSYRQIGIKAILSVPLHKNGKLVSVIGVHQKTPRRWNSTEIELLRLVSMRCWESLQRAQTQRQMASREAHLIKIRDTLPQILFVVSGDNSKINYNRRWYEYTGIDPDEDGKRAWELAHTKIGLRKSRTAWAQAISGERPYEVECRLRASDGSLRWHLARAMPVHDDGGQIIEWIGTYTDIHDRRNFEQKLEQSEARFRNLCETAPTMIWMTDARGNCVYWNSRWHEFTGQTAQEAVPHGWLQAVHPDDVKQAQQAFMQHIKEHSAFSVEYRLRRSDGQYRWCVDAATPHFDVNGEFHGHIGSIMDITERKQTEDATATERSILNLITTGTPLSAVLEEIALSVEARGERPLYCSIMLADNQKKRLHCAAAPHMPVDYNMHFDGIEIRPNDTPSGRAAYFGQQVISAHVVDDVSYGERQSIALEMGIAASCITPIIGSNGVVLGTLNMYYALPYAPSLHEQAMARSASYLAGIVIERNLIDAQLAQSLQSEKAARNQAEHANRIKDEFLATLSHELRTPLNAILGWSRLMQADTFHHEHIHKGLEIIERSARSQAQIIDDLLDMSAILSGKVHLHHEHFDICAMAHSTLDLLRPGALAKHIDLQITGAETPLVFLGDSGRLQQVLTNLLSNAIKFTPAGGRVQITLQLEAQQLRLAVQDSGIGIATDFLPHVFDRFRQADASSTRQAGGLGLGLSISRQLVELHGGSLVVSSAGHNQGATFTIMLPHQRTVGDHSQDWATNRALEGALSPQSVSGLDGIRILLVDDDRDSRSVAEQFLLQAGATVTCACSADAAEQVLEQQRFHILISDIAMPCRDGYQLIQAVRQRKDEVASIRAIALTAYVREDDRERAMLAGFDKHIGKPYDPLQLINAVRLLTRAHSG